MAQPDRWLVVSLHVPPEAPAREVWAAALVEESGSTVLEQADSLVAYFLPAEDPDAFIADLRERLAASCPAAPPPELDWRWQPNQDWEREWRAGLQPRKVTSRLVVKPSWTEWEASPGEVVIRIDPQMAFGTGEHATTRGCLRLLDEVAEPGARVLDIGSGSAILAIAAAMLGADEVIAVEYDGDANINARENVEGNGVQDRVTIREDLADPELLGRIGRFDLVLANILSSVIKPLLPSMVSALRPGGRIIVSGILQSEAEEVLSSAARAGLDLVREDREEEWWSALLRVAE
jgi:ribosomal protein L11 methyltransferase